MALTDAEVRALKGKGTPYRVADGGGLYVQVSKTGSRLWRLKYRYDGREKLLSFGPYPLVSLAEARRKRDDAKRLLLAKIDPGQKPEEPEESVPYESTFKACAYAYLESRSEILDPDYLDLLRRRLAQFILPDLGGLHVGRIEPPTLLACIRKIEDRGTLVTAQKMKTLCGQIFRFAVAEGKATRDPSADVRGALKTPPKAKHRAKVTPQEAPALFSAVQSYEGEDLTRNALLLALHTLTRTQEIRFAKLADFDLTAKEPVWRIPSAIMKMDRPHIVPLSKQVAKLVPTIVPDNPAKGYLFGAFTKSGVISENSMLYALYRMGYHSRQTVHGFRGLGSTILHEAGFDTAWIEMQLAHDDDDKVRSAYNAAQYLPQRRKMLQWWSDFVEREARTGALLS